MVAAIADTAFSMLPHSVAEEIRFIMRLRRGGLASVSELHLCVGRRSSILAFGERIYLCTELSPEDMRATVARLCGGALYAHRDTLCEGYISIEGGIRVGVCGQARYEGGRIVGISEVSSLSFRFPTAECSLGDELCDGFYGCERGMLIYARAGVGKTTALRSIVRRLSCNGSGLRIAVIDERCEFSPADCAECGVDLFRGYRRFEGLNAALRTMSPDVVVIDEIGAEDETLRLLDYLNSGVRIIASAHAGGADELKKRRSVAPFLTHGVFDLLVGIFREDGVYSAKWDRL